MIPEDTIDRYIEVLLNNSGPGDTMHQLLIASVEPGGSRNAFGLPDPTKLAVSVHGILPTEDVDPEGFIAQTIRAAIAKQAKDKLRPIFAGLSIESYAVIDRPADEVSENRARRMIADGQLEQHSEAVEVTMMYAACRDGRRWAAQHIHTGPRAGDVVGPTTRVGPIEYAERRPVRWLVRSAVGLGAMR